MDNRQSSKCKIYPIIHDFRKLSTTFYESSELRNKHNRLHYYILVNVMHYLLRNYPINYCSATYIEGMLDLLSLVGSSLSRYMLVAKTLDWLHYYILVNAMHYLLRNYPIYYCSATYIEGMLDLLSLVGSSLSRYMLVAKTIVPLPHYVVELVKSKILHTDMDCFPETIFPSFQYSTPHLSGIF